MIVVGSLTERVAHRVAAGEFTEQGARVQDAVGRSDVRGGEVSDVASEQDVGAPTSRGGSMDVVVRVGSGHRRNEMLICGEVEQADLDTAQHEVG